MRCQTGGEMEMAGGIRPVDQNMLCCNMQAAAAMHLVIRLGAGGTQKDMQIMLMFSCAMRLVTAANRLE